MIANHWVKPDHTTGFPEMQRHAFEVPDASQGCCYAARYKQSMTGIQMTQAEYEEAYTIPIRVTLETLRGW